MEFHRETMRATLRNIARPIPPPLISSMKRSGMTLSYVSWYDTCDLMDERAPGWCHEIRETGTTVALRGNKKDGYEPVELAHVIVRVTVPCSDGLLRREAIGVDDEPAGQRGTPLERAEASGLRRAFAKLGLARELYGGTGAPLRRRLIEAEEAAAEDAMESPDNEMESEMAPEAEEPPAYTPEPASHWTAEIEACQSLPALQLVHRSLQDWAPNADNKHHLKAVGKLFWTKVEEIALEALGECQTPDDVTAVMAQPMIQLAAQKRKVVYRHVTKAANEGRKTLAAALQATEEE